MVSGTGAHCRAIVWGTPRTALPLGRMPELAEPPASRSAWTDERIDDLVSNLDQTMSLLREEVHGLREETNAGFRELRGEIHGIRSAMFAGALTMIIALIGLIVTLLIQAL